MKTLAYKILLLEDDKLFNETIEDFLEEEGFTIDSVLDPYSALELSYEKKYDLYLFDVNLPYEDGFSLLEKLREAGDRTATIFLTSREDKYSLAKGFQSGCDDYMKKPIDLDELLLRIGAILKRQIRQETFDVGQFTIDVQAKKIYKENELLSLTSKAIELLILLLQAEGKIVTTEHIEQELWHVNEEISRGAIRVYISALKKYFPEEIENIRGVGYRFFIKK